MEMGIVGFLLAVLIIIAVLYYTGILTIITSLLGSAGTIVSSISKLSSFGLMI